MSNFNPSNATLSQLKAFCSDNNIVVDGDRRFKKSYQQAIAFADFLNTPVESYDDVISPYLASKPITASAAPAAKTSKTSSVLALYPVAFVVAILILAVVHLSTAIVNASIKSVQFLKRKYINSSRQYNQMPWLLAIPL